MAIIHNEGDCLRTVIVCPPGEEYFHAHDLNALGMNAAPDREQTNSQFERLVKEMERSGSELLTIDELDGHPNSVFTRDVALCSPLGYIQLRMGLPSRKGEPQWMSEALDSIGVTRAGQIVEPGTVEGGDIILAGDVAFIGHSNRTNREGISQIRKILEYQGYEIRIQKVPEDSLHLGGVMSIIAPRRVVYREDTFPAGFFKGFDTVTIPKECLSSGNVICLGANEVIANSAENQTGINILEDSGVKVHALDLSEFRKGGGGPTCLILPVERE
ncbi:dimethylarginine dimethylaminohydrolase family protein [Acidobacteriota bacterium]